jgi:hypothetical protein
LNNNKVIISVLVSWNENLKEVYKSTMCRSDAWEII